MCLKTKFKRRRSIGEFCHDFRSAINNHIHSLGRFIYDHDNHEILRRDGKRWSKLAAFYFCFYMGLGGFFCFYLSIFMALLPSNQPRYIGQASRLVSPNHPLSPGLSFRPQIGLKLYDIFTLISISLTNEKDRKRSIYDNFEIYTKNLDEFLTVYDTAKSSKKFTISEVGDCNTNNYYGYKDGRPCILLKMNKIVGFIPKIGRTKIDNKSKLACTGIPNIPVRCTGENLVDQEILGESIYYSESGSSSVCGSIDIKHFPYNGKDDRNDVYQAPYVWVQFRNITPHVLISVECRIFGANIFYDKIAQRGSIRFQIYLNKTI